MRLSVTRQFCCKSILWQNRPLYNFGAAGRGGGETHASHRSRRHHRHSYILIQLVCASVCRGPETQILKIIYTQKFTIAGIFMHVGAHLTGVK